MAVPMLLKHVHRLTILLMLLSIIKSASHVAQSLPGCPDKCGNITIPYQFGIRKDCCLSKSYQVNCTTLRVMNTNFKFLDISIDGLMHGFLPMAYSCYNSTGSLSHSQPKIRLSRFRISSTTNLLTTVGCATRADLMDLNGNYDITGCISRTSCKSLTNGSCIGQGCMQVPVPYMMTEFRIRTQRVTRRVGNWSFNNCTYGFLVEKDQYTFQETYLDNMKNRSFQVALEWTVGNTSCIEAKKNKTSYICTENSECSDYFGRTDQGLLGYRCHCVTGYQGNPYLPNGCQDINECEGPTTECVYGCVNTIGSYTCPCPFGMIGDGSLSGGGCYPLEAAKSHGYSLYIGK